tara:strand:- start:349 stop:567 length:219 start_codon:yes stop_codon:yes gene_type:complete
MPQFLGYYGGFKSNRENLMTTFEIELMNPKAEPEKYVFEFGITAERGIMVFRLDKAEYEQLTSAVMKPITRK